MLFLCRRRDFTAAPRGALLLVVGEEGRDPVRLLLVRKCGHHSPRLESPETPFFSGGNLSRFCVTPDRLETSLPGRHHGPKYADANFGREINGRFPKRGQSETGHFGELRNQCTLLRDHRPQMCHLLQHTAFARARQGGAVRARCSPAGSVGVEVGLHGKQILPAGGKEAHFQGSRKHTSSGRDTDGRWGVALLTAWRRKSVGTLSRGPHTEFGVC